MQSLKQIWQDLKSNGYESDKGSIHSYLDVYEKLFESYRNTAINVLEIGLFRGDSLRMWAEYFTTAHIHGIDCSLTPHDGMANLQPLIDECGEGVPDRVITNIAIHIFNAEDVTEVSRRFFGVKFDVIIEDAGHEINQQLNLFRIWSQYLAKDGIYIIEDIQDLESNYSKFDSIGATVIDLRKKKNRYDDVLAYSRSTSMYS